MRQINKNQMCLLNQNQKSNKMKILKLKFKIQKINYFKNKRNIKQIIIIIKMKNNNYKLNI